MMPTKLSWDDQRSAQLRAARSRLGLLKRVAHYCRNRTQKRALYLAIGRSQFEHCCPVWRPTAKSTIDLFEDFQKRAVKYILNDEDTDYTPTEYLSHLKELNLLPMEYFFIHNDLILFHKICK